MVTAKHKTQLIPAVVVLLLAATSSAAPVEERACYYTCGSNCYTQAQVTAAQNKGYSLKQSGSTLGQWLLLLPILPFSPSLHCPLTPTRP